MLALARGVKLRLKPRKNGADLLCACCTQDITLLNKYNKIFSQAHRYAIPHVPAAERASADKAGWGWAAAGRAAGGDSGEYVYEQVYG